MQQADQPLAEVLGLLMTLDEGWSGVAAQLVRDKDVAAGAGELHAVQADPAQASKEGEDCSPCLI